MVDASVLRIADDRIRLELEKDRSRVDREIEAAKAETAARGVLHSGMTIANVAEICAQTAEARADLAWRIMYRTITASGVAYSTELEGQLKAALDKYLQVTDLQAKVDEIIRLLAMQNEGMLKEGKGRVDVAAKRAAERTYNEIELFVVSLRNQSSTASTSGPVFNVYAPIGAIQTGHGATATVTQNIDGETKERIFHLLEALQRSLEATAHLTAPKNEIVELVAEAKTELKRQEPNRSRLRALLSTVGDTVRTVASIRPAYEAVKAAFAAVGIDLP